MRIRKKNKLISSSFTSLENNNKQTFESRNYFAEITHKRELIEFFHLFIDMLVVFSPWGIAHAFPDLRNMWAFR